MNSNVTLTQRDSRTEYHCIMLLKVVMALCRSLYITINVISGLKMMMVTLLSTLLPWEGHCPQCAHFKCDPNTKGLKRRIPLHYAAHNGHLDIIRKLVCDHRCDIIAKDDDGDTPLHLAALGGSLSTLCTLMMSSSVIQAQKDPRAESYCIMLLKTVMLTLSGSLCVN